MKKLTLAVKAEYFDAIKAGFKTEEYRLYNDYWRKRLEDREYDVIEITRGYPKLDDYSKRLLFKYQPYSIKTITHPHFGNGSTKVFALPLTTPIQENIK
ncbi:RNA-binding protein [Candidatus Endobugula sertula]|uniref:RNA-binding protein n=1 Tax=Candidatus Endobugula sertula TaxID=62101 RepID=A0A1D2QRH3_9GAMM|nr:RNA-binding protein [Candidatus Endobugula sertula]